MNTLLLNPATWDLLVDAKGNIAMASDPYSKAQDVASACKLELGELWYNKSKGIPYMESVLGFNPALSLLRSYFEKAALTVPTIVSAKADINPVNSNRILSGTLKFIDQSGIEKQIILK